MTTQTTPVTPDSRSTLPRALTAAWFPDAAGYAALRRHWRGLLRSDRRHSLTAAHHLLYLALLGRDWRRAFTPRSNARQLANGAFENWGLWRAHATLLDPDAAEALLAPFDGLVTPAMLAQVRATQAPLRSWRGPRLTPADFADGAWPFAAYPLAGAVPAEAPDA